MSNLIANASFKVEKKGGKKRRERGRQTKSLIRMFKKTIFVF